ncbi:transposase [Pseudoduganella eburnea]|uniref:Transposase n=1 Tax=Massilia eburnea TaxID=1776165 RepID=A0A6L6QFT3_9BURK|nr:transposase [Massilia eburnea]MTW11079.1 transposase [Massilia eburnea]
MTRALRNYPPGSCLHVIQRGDNRRACFHDDQDKAHYRGLLSEHSLRTGCDIHAYVLMTNHVHLLLTVHERNAQSQLMKAISQFTAHWMHVRNGTTGTMWEGRYHASLIDSEAYLLTCQRYIELNPVRAGIVSYPGHYPWSSYRTNAEEMVDDWLVPHGVYLGLGRDGPSRQSAYRALFELPLTESDLMRIRFAIQNDFAMRKPGKPGSDPRV